MITLNTATTIFLALFPDSPLRAMLMRDLWTRKIKPQGSKVVHNNCSSRGPGNEATIFLHLHVYQ